MVGEDTLAVRGRRVHGCLSWWTMRATAARTKVERSFVYKAVGNEKEKPDQQWFEGGEARQA
jgi:hypothetical protein